MHVSSPHDEQYLQTTCSSESGSGPAVAVLGTFSPISSGELVGEIALSPCREAAHLHRGRVEIMTASGDLIRSEGVVGFWSSGPVVVDSDAEYLVVTVDGFGARAYSHVVTLPTSTMRPWLDPFASGLLLGVLIPTAFAGVRAIFQWRRRYLLSLGQPLRQLSESLELDDRLATRRSYESLGQVVGLSGWAARLRSDVAVLLGTSEAAERERIAEDIRRTLRRHSWKCR